MEIEQNDAFCSSVTFQKSKLFAQRIVNLSLYLRREKDEKVMSNQILRSGTSIGANLAEAQFAASKNDFVNKFHISLKECNETLYWLDLLYDTSFLTKEQYDSMSKDCREIMKLLASSVKTAKQSLSQ